jgi:tetratricopeptide (TPR) repeat protein
MRRAEALAARRLPRREWLLAFLLVAATVVAYLSVWQAGFIWDDDSHLTKNPCIIGPLGFKGIWTTAAATYYPLVLSNFWVQHALWGLNPLPYHLVNVAMHAACGILLWKVLRQLQVKGAWLGAALWALHPVQVESVAWITELKNTQSCFFYLLSIFFFLRWRETNVARSERPRKIWSYGAALFCAVLAILSKSSTVMLPVVLGLCSWWIDGRWRWRDAIKLAPFLFISALASGWTIWEQKFHSGAMGSTWTQTWLKRLIIAGDDVWFYLGKLFWPNPLIFIYPRWTIDASQALAYLPIAAAVGGLILLWWNRNTRLRPIFFAAAYFVVSLFPVLGFFDVYFFRYSFVGDHLQYLASMGPLVLVGTGITTTFVTFRRKSQFLFEIVACSALLVVLATLTWRQCAMYSNTETLWRTTLSRDPDSWMARNNLGVALLEKERFDEALADFQQALKGNPNKAEVLNNMGDAFLRMGRINESFPYLQQALEMEPTRPDVLSNLGNALLRSGHVDEAIVHLQKALQGYPDYVPALNYLGVALLQKGREDESLVHLQHALEIDPDHKSAHFNLANTLIQKGRSDEAITHLQRVLTIDPGDAEAQKNMAWVLATSPEARIRDGAKAVELAEHANQLAASRDPIISLTLAAAYAETGRFPDAIRTAESAMQLAIDSGNMALAGGIRAHIELYRSGRPFRDIR